MYKFQNCQELQKFISVLKELLREIYCDFELDFSCCPRRSHNKLGAKILDVKFNKTVLYPENMFLFILWTTRNMNRNMKAAE